MNAPVDITLYTIDDSVLKLGSSYNFDDRLEIVSWTGQLNSGFPWLSFLLDEGSINNESIVYVTGTKSSEIHQDISMVVNDELGYFMLKESQQLSDINVFEKTDWNKLPESLSWLYSDKPYITTVDLTPIALSLQAALDTGTADSELRQYLFTHTYKNTQSFNNYIVQDFYDVNSILENRYLPSSVDITLGVEYKEDVIDLEFTKVDDQITLSVHTSLYVEILVQQRIGNVLSSQTLIVESDKPLKIIELTYQSSIGELFEKNLISQVPVVLNISEAYDETLKFPIEIIEPIISTNVSIPLESLTSDTTQLSGTSLLLHTADRVILNNVPIQITASSMIFLDKFIEITPLNNSLVNIKYGVYF